MAPIFENPIISSRTPISNEAFCVKYPVPIHEGNGIVTKEFMVLSWPVKYFIDIDPNAIISPYAKITTDLSKFPIPKGIESKFENSLIFFKWFEINIVPMIVKKEGLKKQLMEKMVSRE